MYPYVQNFCNPPPMPLFLQTCRLWYRGCPKYEQFHYASQFIHSKANKGKVLRKTNTYIITVISTQFYRRSDAFPFESASDSSVHRFDQFSDSRGLVHQARTKSPFTKPGLWEPNPDNPHNRDHANKFYYAPVSASADWLSGQLAWGGHWAVPAAGVGGTNGYSTVHFPSIGSFLGIDDDYD
uniref:C2H2-type domain-containing protein n=1 Tax=Syphacia muris TaxID=451379 RepID=A0A0N5AVK5_9BILA